MTLPRPMVNNGVMTSPYCDDLILRPGMSLLLFALWLWLLLLSS
jgi:hypothetical protein